MKLFLPLTISTILSAAGAFAQQAPPSQQQQQQDSQATTLTGCLTKGTNTGEYMITDSKSGQKYTFAGPDRLDSYVNHTVQLTGKMNMSGNEKAFQPQSIKTVSDTCSGGGR
jgi:hypothetical protein